MGIADKYNKATNRFEFQSDSTFDFFRLSDLYNEDPEAVHIVRALWVNEGGNYGRHLSQLWKTDISIFRSI